MRIRILAVSLAALAGCSSNNGNGVTCGTGTTQVGDQCVAGSGGSGGSGDVTCGSGTVLDGDTCVVASTDAAAPTITMITPNEAGVYGAGPFEIDGTGFAGDNVTDLHVYFGDPSNPDCEAGLGTPSATTIFGQVPIFCGALNTQVTVVTNLGSASVPFQYDAIFAADGNGGGNTSGAGSLGIADIYIIDPFWGTYFDLGPVLDGSGNPYDFDGIAFDSTGANLYVATTGYSSADLAANPEGDYISILYKVDLTTGSATVLGNATDGSDSYIISDVKFSGGTLYGWAYDQDAETQELVTIDTGSGTVSLVGSGSAVTFIAGGIAFDGSGTLYVAANGAGSDSGSDGVTEIGATGELDTASLTTGVLTDVALLDWTSQVVEDEFGSATIGAPIDAMDTFEGTMIAVVDDGTVGVETDTPLAGETLAAIDTTSTPIVQALFDLPAQAGFTSAVDAIAIPPAGGAALPLVRRHFPSSEWKQLKAHANAPSLARRVRR